MDSSAFGGKHLAIYFKNSKKHLGTLKISSHSQFVMKVAFQEVSFLRGYHYVGVRNGQLH
jgi:hypothetical protein